jgi:putative phosphoserine phosphatase/1-acylglycerol-3-phosphate O-acyltransferase
VEIDALLEEIRTGPVGPQVAVFFDFDGTLIDGYSAGALYSHRLRNFEIGPSEALHTIRAVVGGPLSEDQFADLMTRGIGGWAGRPVEDIEELGERLFAQGIAGSLFHQAWRLVKAHQRKRHTLAIATSATRFQAAPIARELGIANLLCTELESEEGLLTGRIAGRTLWGPGKLAAVELFAADSGIDLSIAYAYANGNEDVPFLACGQPAARAGRRGRTTELAGAELSPTAGKARPETCDPDGRHVRLAGRSRCGRDRDRRADQEPAPWHRHRHLAVRPARQRAR